VRWINVLELPAKFENILIPTACLGSYGTQLWLGSLWPIVFLLVVAAGSVGWEFIQPNEPHLTRVQANRAALLAGVQRVLPLVLALTFLLVPSTSTRIFETFLCDRIEFRTGEVRRYLRNDLSLDCDADEYRTTQRTALAMMIIWPVGTPVLYSVLLWASREALGSKVPTELSRATAFLYGDYVLSSFWWEPFEMCRKLTVVRHL
jgi:hypothetical protein